MRKFKPAPKQASANRIRERYLHQLGLQRGGGANTSATNNDQFDNHHHQVVVISGLPSLPEDRATNDDNTRGGHVLESHDFSLPNGGGDGSYTSYGDDHNPFPPPYYGAGDSSHCSRSTLSTSPHNSMGSSNNNVNVANEHITSMALPCPHSLLKNNHQYYGVDNNNNNSGTTNSSSSNNNSSSTGALPFSLSWGRNSTSQLSRSAAAVLSAEVPGGGGASSQPAAAAAFRNNDHDSVSSAATATTAESSFTATMVSRDWGNASATPAVYYPSGTASVSSLGGDSSIASAPGVFFQGRQHCPLGTTTTTTRTTPPSSYNSRTTTGVVGTLASALNRFNIDSDCEVSSVASNSIMEDPTSMMEDCNIDDSASCTSRTSHVSCEGGGGGGGGSVCSISSRSQQRVSKKKKVGKNQRLMDRALAHEQRMQMRKEQSQKLRANMVHSQRMNHCSVRGLPTMPHQSPSGQSRSSSSTTASSIPLMHVHHQATPLNTPNNSSGKENTTMEILKGGGGGGQSLSGPLLLPVLPKHPSFGSQDLGRTPTASNCSQYTKGTTAAPNMVLPVGVHSNYHFPLNNGRPLGCQPQLASRIPTPPPPRKVAAAPPPSSTASSSSSVSLPSSSNAPSRDELLVVSESNSTTQVSEMEMDLANVVSSLQHCKHGFGPPPAAAPSSTVGATTAVGEGRVEDDVMEVAVTLSMLGGSGRATPSSAASGAGGMIPRVR